MSASRPGTPIAPLLRAVLGLEVFFNIASLATITLFPDQTATRFAWRIDSLVMAGVLGGLYVTTVPTAVIQFLARRWEMIRVMVRTVIVFTAAELVATILHWDKFFAGTLRFNIWLASYTIPPVALVGMYLYQEKRSTHLPVQNPIPAPMRKLFIVLGVILAGDGVATLISPEWLTRSFPWTLTPLTARVLAGWVLAVATLLLSIAKENDRDRVRIASPVLILLLPSLAFEVIRFREQVDFAHPRIWINLVVFSILCLCGLSLAKGGWREVLR